MKIGLLYSNNSKEITLAEKIDKAIAFYKKRHQSSPNECHINPTHLEGFNVSKVNGVKIVSDAQIRLHDFWVGRKGDGK